MISSITFANSVTHSLLQTVSGVPLVEPVLLGRQGVRFQHAVDPHEVSLGRGGEKIHLLQGVNIHIHLVNACVDVVLQVLVLVLVLQERLVVFYLCDPLISGGTKH